MLSICSASDNSSVVVVILTLCIHIMHCAAPLSALSLLNELSGPSQVGLLMQYTWITGCCCDAMGTAPVCPSAQPVLTLAGREREVRLAEGPAQ